MKLMIKIVTLSALILSSSLSAADLTLPRTVDVLAVNGKAVKETQSLNLSQGHNQVVIRYVESLRNGSGKKRFQSKPLVTFIDVENASDQLNISHKYFRTYDSAKVSFATNNADWTLTVNNAKSPLVVDELPGESGFLPYRDLEKSIVKYNDSHNIQFTEVHSPVPEKTLAPKVTDRSVPTDIPVISELSVKEIKQWFLHASGSERKALLTWMIQQQ
ncbi:hypothetical protein DI392_00515 [Vibrio albus]|uniref:DUF2057 domain-containing protein n=1 Tax=Vibrio albus TaxID=2200953 RepID=A0A2U3BDD9_9VIBR|nr:DUF2057 family protein [Vibrio albus]PWI34801.1 hypothetical protein DI392_00515 [Vibrio albus]